MVRVITTIAVAGILLAMLALWRNGEPSRVSESIESQSADDAGSPPSVAKTPPPALDNSAYVPERTSLRTEPNILNAITRQRLPDVEVPSWSDGMEGMILSHIAQYPGLALTELQVQCAVSECVIFMSGGSVPVYEMGFDVFASENGFRSAIIHSIDGGPSRIVYLNR